MHLDRPVDAGGSILLDKPVELGLGGGAAKRGFSVARIAAIKAPFQFLAHFLGAVGSQRQLDQAAQGWPARTMAAQFGIILRRFHVIRFQVFCPVDQRKETFSTISALNGPPRMSVQCPLLLSFRLEATGGTGP
jgi:hypothetical protein